MWIIDNPIRYRKQIGSCKWIDVDIWYKVVTYQLQYIPSIRLLSIFEEYLFDNSNDDVYENDDDEKDFILLIKHDDDDDDDDDDNECI